MADFQRLNEAANVHHIDGHCDGSMSEIAHHVLSLTGSLSSTGTIADVKLISTSYPRSRQIGDFRVGVKVASSDY